MKQTLTWNAETGLCTNPPHGWEIVANVVDEGGTEWTAQHDCDGVKLEVPSNHPSLEFAQRDCEATLYLLGAIPLPAWTSPRHNAWRHCEVGDLVASICVNGAWGVYDTAGGSSLKYAGQLALLVNETLARKLAEAFLRTLIALRLRGTP